MIRAATWTDVQAILNIYAPYIRETAITFEYEVPEISDFLARFERIAEKYPWLVWEENGKILGYAYADQAFARKAYAWDADMSIYLDMNARGRGIGEKLYECLEQILRAYGYHNLYALITGDNLVSVRFHKRRNYAHLGTLEKSGWKFGKWYDVHWYGLRLCEACDPGEVPKAFACTENDRAIMARCGEK